MKIQFFGETRKQFANVNTEGAVPLLGSFDVKEILLTERWQEAAEATISFLASPEWVQNNLYPGRNPGTFDAPFRRARYFTFRKENSQLMTFPIMTAEAEPSGTDMLVSVKGADPRFWAETMSSSSVITGENWNASRLSIAQWLSQRLSNTLPTGMEQWQALPLTSLDAEYSPTPEEAAIGVRKPSAVSPTGNIEIGIPDPLPVKGSIDDLFATWANAELYPIDKFGKDGTESPWWDWGIRTRLNTDHSFSEFDGSMKINRYSMDWTKTETLTYNSNNPIQHSYSAGQTSSRTTLYGPWAGIRTESVTPPEGANVENFLRSKATTGTMNNSRLVVDCTINFSKKNVQPVCGMIVNTRIGSKIYPANINEINHHFSYETGWTSSSPVFIDMDSVDLSDPPENGADIQFVVNGDRFIVPTNSPTNSYYSWRIFVDGNSYGVYQGTSATNSPGIDLIFSSAGEHEIILQPSDRKYYPGWGRAFGFYTTVSSPSTSVNHLNNKNKLLRVVLDNDYAHLLEEKKTGPDFRSYQFQECRNLEAITAEDMPDVVEDIGANFRAYQYQGCRKLTYAPAEYISNRTLIIDSNFRAYQYSDTRAIPTAASQMIPDSVLYIYSGYRKNQYSGSYITTAANEAMSSEIRVIGNDFMRSTYSGCTRLTVAGIEAAPNVSEIPDYYRDSIYSGCTSLTSPVEEKLGSSTTKIGNNFRSSQYSGTGLLIATPEVIGSVQVIGNSFRYRQYSSSQIIKAADEVLNNNTVAIGTNFRNSQYYICRNLTTAAEEKFSNSITVIPSTFRLYQYAGCFALTTSPNEVLSNEITEINGDFRRQQFSGCSSLISVGAEFFPIKCTHINLRGFRRQQYESIGAAIAVDEAPMPNLINNGSDFRYMQYYNSKILEIGKEADMPNLKNNESAYFRYRQYANCPNISNNKKYTEGAMPLNVGNSSNSYYRDQQFANSGIIYALKENSANSSYNPGYAFNHRYRQYENCVNLVETYREYDNVQVWTSNEYVRYRQEQFRNCVNLDLTNKEIIQKVSISLSSSSTFRNGQFAGTRYRNEPGFRLKYIDGTDVIEGENNIPADFYTDPTPPAAPTLTQACVYSENEAKIYWTPPSGTVYTAIVFERETATDVFERVSGITEQVSGGYETTFSAEKLPSINPGRIRAMTKLDHFGSEILSTPVFVQIDTSAETCTNL